MSADAADVFPPPPSWFRAVQVHATPLHPPVPVDSELSIYGVARTVSDTEVMPLPLEHQQYSEDVPPCTELRRLNALLLSTFGRLVPALADAQPVADGGAAEIRELFLNLEHLLNSLRAQQAREELIGLFEAQSALKKQLLEDLQRAGARALSAAVPRAEALECDAAQREAAAAALGGPTSLAAEDDNAASAAGTGVSLEHLAHAFEAQGQAAVPRQPG